MEEELENSEHLRIRKRWALLIVKANNKKEIMKDNVHESDRKSEDQNKNNIIPCDNTPLADPHYLNLLSYSWPSDCLEVSLNSSQGYFTFLYRHIKHNIHNWEGGGKENK